MCHPTAEIYSKTVYRWTQISETYYINFDEGGIGSHLGCWLVGVHLAN